MNGSAAAPSNQSSTRSSSTEGAKGRNFSRNLILALISSRMSARRGSATMLRFPSARAPHSMRPWNHPTTHPPAISSAAVRHSSSSLPNRRTSRPRAASPRPARSACTSAPGYAVPQYACSMAPARGRPRSWFHTQYAAPSAVPLSAAAGCTKTSRKGVRSRIFPLATLFMAHPPPRQRRGLRVRSHSPFSTWKAHSSYTSCSDRASASCAGERGSPGARAGPRSRSSSGVYTRPTVGDPSLHSISTPSDAWRKYFSSSSKPPPGRRRTSRRISSTRSGAP